MVHPIQHLPQTIVLGKQTESGVELIGFNCAPWLDKWPDMALSVWPTRPGENAAYPAPCRVKGGVLYWLVSSADTALSGKGTVEILGSTPDGKRRISRATVATQILPTTLTSEQEIPPLLQPWVDEVVIAADRAHKSAAESAESAASSAASAAASEESRQAAKASEDAAKTSADAATENAAAAAKSAEEAEESADRAEMAAAESGWFDLVVNDAGHLIYTRSSNVDNIDFAIKEGRLVVIYG